MIRSNNAAVVGIFKGRNSYGRMKCRKGLLGNFGKDFDLKAERVILHASSFLKR